MPFQYKDIGKSKPRRDYTLLAALITIAALLILWLIFDLSGYGGNIRFYSKWIECGRKPVGTNLQGNFGGGSVQYYGDPPTTKFMRLSPTYFCTPFEAEKHGYSANPDSYEFPVLKKAGALCQKPGEPKSETAAQFSDCP